MITLLVILTAAAISIAYRADRYLYLATVASKLAFAKIEMLPLEFDEGE